MNQINVNLTRDVISMDRQRNLGFVDALRGVAILMVIVTHVSPATPDVSGLMSSLCSYGRMGVQLFFVLSAFTLCLTYADRTNDPYSVSKFYIRRYLRIAPMYYFGILFYTSLAIVDGGIESISYTNVGWHFSLLHGLNMAAFNNVVPGGWSIGVEFIFYLIFPFVFNLVHGSFRWVVIVLALSIIISLGLYSYFVFYIKLDINAYSLGYWNFVNQLPVFIVGFLLYIHFSSSNAEPSSIVLNVIFFGFTAISLLLYMLKPKFSTVFIPIASAISFYALAILFSKYSFLANGALRAIGKVSFSMYLIHFVVIDIVTTFGFGFLAPNAKLLLNYLVVTIITYFIAQITYRYIEAKGIFMAKKITLKF